MKSTRKTESNHNGSSTASNGTAITLDHLLQNSLIDIYLSWPTLVEWTLCFKSSKVGLASFTGETDSRNCVRGVDPLGGLIAVVRRREREGTCPTAEATVRARASSTAAGCRRCHVESARGGWALLWYALLCLSNIHIAQYSMCVGWGDHDISSSLIQQQHLTILCYDLQSHKHGHEPRI